MKSRAVRALLVILAVAALAGAALAAWKYDQQIATERSAADTFERDARQAVIAVTELRAAQQAYVAEGQPAETWQARVTGLGEAVAPRLTALRLAAGSVDAQSALETAVEAFSTFAPNDARARDYLKAGQSVSASDVIFTDGAAILAKVVNAVDTARGQESVARAVAIADARLRELVAAGAGAGMTLLVLLLLWPIPRSADFESGGELEAEPGRGGGLGLSDEDEGIVRRAEPVAQAWPTAGAAARTKDDPLAHIDFDAALRAPKTPDLATVADLCSSLARVQDQAELQSLLERAARMLDATGLIIWMPDVTQGALRPVMAHGYAPLALTRMGIIYPTADNATATAFRTRTVMVVPSEPLASGAVVAPLITADGCSGAMAVALREGVEATDHVRAVATILAAQLATLFTPAAPVAAAVPDAATAPAVDAGPAAPAAAADTLTFKP